MSRAKSLTPASAVHRHEANMHKGHEPTKFKKGGKATAPRDPVGPKGAVSGGSGSRITDEQFDRSMTEAMAADTKNRQSRLNMLKEAAESGDYQMLKALGYKRGGEVMRKKMMVGGPMNKPPLPAQASPTAVAARMKMPGQENRPVRPVTPAGAPMKKGGRACMAAGGVAKIRHNEATKAGAPKAAGKKMGNLI